MVVLGGMASGQCESDACNNEATAILLSFNDSISDYVCPDDLWDFYAFNVAGGSDISGMITFTAEQSGTTIRIMDPNGELLFPRTGTSDGQRTLWIPIDEGALIEGTYYIRVGFWSAAAYDHQYTLSMDLSIPSECAPDGNDEPENASDLSFRTTVSDWLCADDHIDIWHFTVAEGDEYKSTISMTANPGELFLYLYDSDQTQLFQVRTEDGELEYNLGVNGHTLMPGDYYIGVFLPLARDDENSYSLILQKPLVFKPMDPVQLEIQTFEPQQFTPVGCRADQNNSEDTAVTIQINQKITGWVCEDDPWDYFTFDVPTGAKLKGNIKLSSPQQLTIFSVYNKTTGEKYIESKFTTEDELEFSALFRAGDLTPGTYYISVTRMSNTTFDHQYTIEMDIAGYESEVTWARFCLDSFYCEKESIQDEGSSDDEPYFKFIQRYMNLDPTGTNYWYDGSPQVFSDVDSGENRRFTTSQRKLFEGEILDNPRWAHFDIELWEDDTVTNDDHEDTLTVLLDLDSLFMGGYVKTDPQGSAWATSVDGHIASIETLLWSRDTYPTENKYYLRWHIEFDPYACLTNTGKKFTHSDDFAVGKFFEGGQETYVIANDEDAHDHFGRFYFYNSLGFTVKQFDGGFDKYDRIAAGDMDGDGIDEVVVASKRDGGYVTFYDTYTEDSQYCYSIPFTTYDGLAVADVNGDGVCEVLMAKDDNDMVYIYNAAGTLLHEFDVGWDFKGVRYTDSNTRHDAFLVGDVKGDATPEIVMIENKNGENSKVHVYEPFYVPGQVHLVPPLLTDFRFTHYDGACLGDVNGNDKQELLIALDSGDGYNGCQIHIYNIATGKRTGVRYWPVFQKYDGFAAGDVLGAELGNGHEQILLASQDDDTVYISQ